MILMHDGVEPEIDIRLLFAGVDEEVHVRHVRLLLQEKREKRGHAPLDTRPCLGCHVELELRVVIVLVAGGQPHVIVRADDARDQEVPVRVDRLLGFGEGGVAADGEDSTRCCNDTALNCPGWRYDARILNLEVTRCHASGHRSGAV